MYIYKQEGWSYIASGVLLKSLSRFREVRIQLWLGAGAGQGHELRSRQNGELSM